MCHASLSYGLRVLMLLTDVAHACCTLCLYDGVRPLHCSACAMVCITPATRLSTDPR